MLLGALRGARTQSFSCSVFLMPLLGRAPFISDVWPLWDHGFHPPRGSAARNRRCCLV